MDYFQRHPEVDLPGSWIIFERPKTGEYGEWVLWPEVDELVRWGIERSKRLGVERLLVTEKGKPWYNDNSENGSMKFGKWWQANPTASDPHEGIVTRLSREIDGFPRHTVKTLRKILPSILRPKYGKEIADLANARKVGFGGTVNGQVTDRYADRRYDQLAEAILEAQSTFRTFLDALKGDNYWMK